MTDIVRLLWYHSSAAKEAVYQAARRAFEMAGDRHTRQINQKARVRTIHSAMPEGAALALEILRRQRNQSSLYATVKNAFW
jgi:hypothetical protein